MKHSNAWHTMNIDQIVTRLETNAASGLGRKQALKRRHTLQVRRPEATRALFLPAAKPLISYVGKMFLDPIVILGLFIAVVAFVFEQYLFGGTVAILILRNCITCGIANARAAGVFENLQLYSNPMTKVIRLGKLYTMDARSVVPGDLVVMTPGDICPADIRLEKGSNVTVSQYVYDASAGKLKLQLTEKNGDIVYSPDQDVHNPDIANIVYAGSVIEKGYARGIAVETGAYTYVGAVNGNVPGAQVTSDPESLIYTKKLFSRIMTLQAILLLPLTVVLTITLSNTMTIAECFLTALALSLTSVTEQIVSLGRTIVCTGIKSAAQVKENDATAIVKNHRASDRLCDMTDLFLLDSSAISDGKYHLESVYAGGAIYTDREFADKNNRDVRALAGDLYLYRSAVRPPEAQVSEHFDDVFAPSVDALIKHFGIDTTALTWNRKSSRISWENGQAVAHNEMSDGDYQIIISQYEELLAECAFMQSNDQTVDFDDSNHIALRTLCRIYRESGYRIILVAHKNDGVVTLMGVTAFAQHIGKGFSDCCEELIDSGVRISVFMDHTPETIKILTESGLVRDENNDVLTARRAESEGLELPVAYGSYRAYLGFSDQQIAELTESLKKRGNRIACYCIDNSKQHLHQMADLTITCDAVEYRSAKVAESLYERMPASGKPTSSRASQNTRRRSDVILRRASAKGGGLHGILTGRASAFAIHHNLANLITYLLTVQIFRTVLVAVPALFATPTLKPLSILMCGLLLDPIFAVLFSLTTPDKSTVTSAYPITRRLEKPLAYNTANVVSAAVSALVLWLGIAVLQVTGIFTSPEQCMGLAFVSTFLLQGTVFLITKREYAKNDLKNGNGTKIRILATVGYIVILAACICLPGLDGLTAGNGLNALGLILSPSASVIYYLLYRILSASGLNLHK